MERKGRYFEFGAPHFYNGVSYCWPDDKKRYDDIFKEGREKLEKSLVDKLRGYIREFKVRTFSDYPYSQMGMRGITLHLGDGGRWIEAWKMPGSYFIAPHNLDAWADRAACFNIGSDILEFVDETILAPRVSASGENYFLKYPVPDGQNLIESPLFSEEDLARVFKLVRLEGTPRIIRGDIFQKVESSHGEIIIENGLCEGRGFKSWDIAKASWIIASIMSLFQD